MGIDLKEMIDKMLPTRKQRKKIKIREARPIIEQEEMERLVDMDQIVNDAIGKVQESGIIFLDEIDKIIARDGGSDRMSHVPEYNGISCHWWKAQPCLPSMGW